MPVLKTASSPNRARSELSEALTHMISALELLDKGSARPDIGAHLDLAIARLSESLECPWPAPVRKASFPG